MILRDNIPKAQSQPNQSVLTQQIQSQKMFKAWMLFGNVSESNGQRCM